MTLREALLGGPGLDGYAWNADVYCVDCGQAITRECFETHETREDDEVPYPIFFGEHEYAQHCAFCGEYLYGGDME